MIFGLCNSTLELKFRLLDIYIYIQKISGRFLIESIQNQKHLQMMRIIEFLLKLRIVRNQVVSIWGEIQ